MSARLRDVQVEAEATTKLDLLQAMGLERRKLYVSCVYEIYTHTHTLPMHLVGPCVFVTPCILTPICYSRAGPLTHVILYVYMVLAFRCISVQTAQQFVVNPKPSTRIHSKTAKQTQQNIVDTPPCQNSASRPPPRRVPEAPLLWTEFGLRV